MTSISSKVEGYIVFVRFWGNFLVPKIDFRNSEPPRKKTTTLDPRQVFFLGVLKVNTRTPSQNWTHPLNMSTFIGVVSFFFIFFCFFCCVLFSVKMTDLENPVQKNGFYQYIQKILGIKKDETPEILGKKSLPFKKMVKSKNGRLV